MSDLIVTRKQRRKRWRRSARARKRRWQTRGPQKWTWAQGCGRLEQRRQRRRRSGRATVDSTVQALNKMGFVYARECWLLNFDWAGSSDESAALHRVCWALSVGRMALPAKLVWDIDSCPLSRAGPAAPACLPSFKLTHSLTMTHNCQCSTVGGSVRLYFIVATQRLPTTCYLLTFSTDKSLYAYVHFLLNIEFNFSCVSVLRDIHLRYHRYSLTNGFSLLFQMLLMYFSKTASTAAV